MKYKCIKPSMHAECQKLSSGLYIWFTKGVLLVLFLAYSGYCIKDSVPNWLDTTAPEITIQPQQQWHSSLFHISFSANEHAKIWYNLGSSENMQQYETPIAITSEGPVKVYFYGEDDFGNRTSTDSVQYVLDTRPPSVDVSPPSGHFSKPVEITVTTDEKCRLMHVRTPDDKSEKEIASTFMVEDRFEGYIVAQDRAGNRSITNELSYVVDTTIFAVNVHPNGGVYNRSQKISFTAEEGVTVYYSFDPLASPKWFKPYEEPIPLPYGLSVLRYFGKNTHGLESPITRTKFVVDTIPPKLHVEVERGPSFDTIYIVSREKVSIRYTLDGKYPNEDSPTYERPLQIPQKGRCILLATAIDKAGNQSDPVRWECKYDSIPPIVNPSKPGGSYNSEQTIHFSSNEPANVLYSFSEDTASEYPYLYKPDEGVKISREGWTIIRYIGVDKAENRSEEKVESYYIDTKPPIVRVKINGSVQKGSFLVELSANEPASIYYELGSGNPGRGSPEYQSPIPMQTGQILRYLAVDSLGNAGTIQVMDDLHSPLVSAVPEGGVYNSRINISFAANVQGSIYWRLLPDTSFRPYNDSLLINTEGAHSLEYYIETPQGVRSPIRRNEYFTDWTAPFVQISVKKSKKDSVTIFFLSNENASIYYTTDGSNPEFSATTKMVGNKFTSKLDRIIITRRDDTQFAFYAEDAAGNRSTISVLDVFRPRVIPNIPAGPDQVYGRILSISLNTFDQSTVYYSLHGNTPTPDSSIFSEPITLMKSDTITAFAIDVAGFRGDLDTFVYLIDLPPSPRFTTSPDSIFRGMKVTFDASATIDNESPLESLKFRWDFDGDGTFDTKAAKNSRIAHTFPKTGRYNTLLEVTDPKNRIATTEQPVDIYEYCPDGMKPMIASDGHSYCIDVYEWPNLRGKLPLSGVTWVEAKMYCIDAGKRLCTQDEWQQACRSTTKKVYPYGNKYDEERCPVYGTELWKSGSFKKCQSNGLYDMVGNAWEWVEDKNGDYPLLMGGSYRYGKNAHCELQSPGTVASQSDDIGFRCCK